MLFRCQFGAIAIRGAKRSYDVTVFFVDAKAVFLRKYDHGQRFAIDQYLDELRMGRRIGKMANIAKPEISKKANIF